MTWFEELTGFREMSPGQVHKNIAVDGEKLTSSVVRLSFSQKTGFQTTRGYVEIWAGRGIKRPRERRGYSDNLRHFQIPTKCVCQFHLPRRLTLHIEQRRIRNEYRHTLRARCRDIQSVSAVQEFHATRRILRS